MVVWNIREGRKGRAMGVEKEQRDGKGGKGGDVRDFQQGTKSLGYGGGRLQKGWFNFASLLFFSLCFENRKRIRRKEKKGGGVMFGFGICEPLFFSGLWIEK